MIYINICFQLHQSPLVSTSNYEKYAHMQKEQFNNILDIFSYNEPFPKNTSSKHYHDAWGKIIQSNLNKLFKLLESHSLYAEAQDKSF